MTDVTATKPLKMAKAIDDGSLNVNPLEFQKVFGIR